MSMNSRRNEILDEMGLSPRWQLRPGVTAPGAAQPGTPIAAVAAAPTPSPREVAPALSLPAATATSEAAALSPAAHEPAQCVAAPPASELADSAVLRPAAEVAPLPEVARTAPSPATDDRRVAVMQMDWPQLAHTVADCTACPLSNSRQCTVFGVGDRRASWLFVGEGPGAEEDERGEPFVGQAGRLLDNMLAALKLKRGEDVYVANIVKCRPPGNRTPAAAEVAACEPYLHRQIALIEPKLIVALGKTAAVTLLGKEQTLASMRGQVFRYCDTPLIVTYHPAYLLRTPADKLKAWEDLCFARGKLREWQSNPDAGMIDAHDVSIVPTDAGAAPSGNPPAP